MNPFLGKSEPIERNFEHILKLYQHWLSFTRKGDNFDTKSIEIIALFLAFRGIFTLFSAFDGSFDR